MCLCFSVTVKLINGGLLNSSRDVWEKQIADSAGEAGNVGEAEHAGNTKDAGTQARQVLKI